jgi:hypothetical protein
MKRAIIALIAASIATPSGASVCSEVTGLIQQSRDNFRSIRGAYDSDLEEYAATVTLPGADECTIEEDEYNAEYRCTWPFASSDEAQARSAVASLTSAVQQCFPAARTRDFNFARFQSRSRRFAVDDDTDVDVGIRLHENARRPQYNRWVVDLEVKVDKP